MHLYRLLIYAVESVRHQKVIILIRLLALRAKKCCPCQYCVSPSGTLPKNVSAMS